MALLALQHKRGGKQTWAAWHCKHAPQLITVARDCQEAAGRKVTQPAHYLTEPASRMLTC
jgi:hypothetical protein